MEFKRDPVAAYILRRKRSNLRDRFAGIDVFVSPCAVDWHRRLRHDQIAVESYHFDSYFADGSSNDEVVAVIGILRVYLHAPA